MYRLTTPQQNIWNLRKYYPETSITNICCSILFNEPMDISYLEKAIHEVVKAQGGLRLQIKEINGIPMQKELQYRDFLVQKRMFSTYDDFDTYASQYAKILFSLHEEYLFRFEIVNVAGKQGILLCMDHLICDAWTINLIAKQVYSVYQSIISGNNPNIKETTYSDVVKAEEKYQSSLSFQRDQKYWVDKYSDMPNRCSVCSDSSSAKSPIANRYLISVPVELSEAIQRYGQDKGISPAILFEAAMSIYLSKINRETGIVSVGALVLNRATRSEKKTAGMFVSTVPLRIECQPEKRISDLLQDIVSTHSSVFRHQKYPYSLIMRDLRNRFNLSYNLYDVIISYQNAVTELPAETYWYSNGYCEVPLEIHVDNRDSAKQYTLNIDYHTEIFNETEIHFLTERLLFILQQIVSEDKEKIKDVEILPEAEKTMVVRRFNSSDVPYDSIKTVHELFAKQVCELPDKTALIFNEESFTYRQLDEMSNCLAHFLRNKGVSTNSVVPIISTRSWHVIVAMLGILKAGGAYMPVDPAYPQERMEYMFETAQSRIALTYGYEVPLSIESFSLESFDFYRDVGPVDNINSSDDLCYVIFTSGSTGKPKGVSITHRNVTNYCNDNNNNNVCHSIIQARHDAIISVTNIVFDIFVTESLLPLLNAITVYFADDEQVFSQKKLSELILSGKIDVMQTTPTKMRSYILDKKNVAYLKNLKAIVLGGEALPVDLYEELSRYTDARIFNIYGPAETTVWSTNKEVTGTEITIGKPIANTQVYVLDKDRNLLPVGVAGELCIAGDGVGKGYLNRPDLTAERFIPNPFATEENGHGEIMYCTGDLARWREDGEIEYLGRIDTQVKIRGLRIELSEIESVMAGYPDVQLVAVTDKKDENGRQYLVGYYTADTEIDEKGLRRHLMEKLPKYMVPNYFMHLESMPMTASGKTDRKSLPVPEFTVNVSEYVAPSCLEEDTLCQVLREIFQIERIGVKDDFFDLGGDSLRAIEYVARAHVAGIDFTLQNVFDYPTVQRLWEFIRRGDILVNRYDPVVFTKYENLLAGNIIDETWQPVKKELGNVLLTGCTGFLGAHILEQLIRREQGDIYCLVRGSEQRLLDILHYYFEDSYDALVGNRVHCIIGDITDGNLNELIPTEIQTVIHAAATVKHFGSYSYFERINVRGTKALIHVAQERGAQLIHISTVSVSGNTFVDAYDGATAPEQIDYDEQSLYKGQPLDNVYVRSKFEAELAVLDAMLNGLSAKIVRVGNLTNRASDNKFQPNYESNAFLTRVKAGIELGYLPDYLMGNYLEYSPVDQTAEGIILIAQYADKHTIFHLNSNKELYFDRMVTLLQELGIKMNVLEGCKFNEMLQKLVKDQETEYIYEAFQNDLDEQGNLLYEGNIHIRNDFTVWFMKRIGFEWIDIDREYIFGYIQYFRKLGYFNI